MVFTVPFPGRLTYDRISVDLPLLRESQSRSFDRRGSSVVSRLSFAKVHCFTQISNMSIVNLWLLFSCHQFLKYLFNEVIIYPYLSKALRSL